MKQGGTTIAGATRAKRIGSASGRLRGRAAVLDLRDAGQGITCACKAEQKILLTVSPKPRIAKITERIFASPLNLQPLTNVGTAEKSVVGESDGNVRTSAALVGIAVLRQQFSHMSVTSYRGYLIDHLNHVCSIVTIEAVDLASACAQAETALGQTRFAAIEVWDGTRIVARRSAPRRLRLPWLSQPDKIAE